MKKISIYSMAFVLGAALVACDNYKEPNPPAQYNPQDPVLTDADVAVETLVDPNATYNLETLATSQQNITLATVSVEDLAPGYTVAAQAFISSNGFETQYEVPATVVENMEKNEETSYYDVMVSPEDLQAVYVQNVTRNPKAATISIRALLEVVNGNQVAYIGGPENYVAETPLTILPMPTDFVIEEAYYLIGTIDDWSVANSGAYKFSHANTDVYDDPIFSIIVDITPDQAASGWWWKIIPQSTYDAGDWVNANYSQFGVAKNGDTSPSGKLVPSVKDGEDVGAGQFTESGPWKLTINMMDLTYEFTSAVENLWVPGGANNWTFADAQMLTTKDYEVYQGYSALVGEYKFTTQPDWNTGVAYGEGEEEGELSSGGGNLSVETPGLYWCSVNLTELTYKNTYISTYGIIGSATPGDWNESTALTQSEDYLTFTGTVALTVGEFKFRANNGWDFNLGGELDNLTQDGANINCTEAGTYEITLNLAKVPYTATLVKK